MKVTERRKVGLTKKNAAERIKLRLRGKKYEYNKGKKHDKEENSKTEREKVGLRGKR